MSIVIKPILKTFGVIFMAFLIFFSSFPVSSFVSQPHGKIIDQLYLSKIGKRVIDNFGARTAEAAMASSTLQYLLNIGPINGSTAVGYNYASFFNPTGSGKTMVVKKVRLKSDAVNTAVYQTLSLRRTTAASGGTQITAANIPKNNSDSSNSVAEVRYANPSVAYLQATTTDARMLMILGASAAGTVYSKNEQDFGTDEDIILQEGEGLALMQETAGDADQRISMYLEWEEVVSAPAARGEYMLNYPRIEVAAGAGYVYHSLFNPSGTGKTAVVKRISIEVNCDTTAVYTNNISLRRITAASGGTQITAANIPKKNTDTANSVLEARKINPTVTFVQASTTEARILNVTPCGAANQSNAFRNLRFSDSDEKLILQPGEGIALISESAGDVDQIVRLGVEWAELDIAPAAAGEYMLNYPRVELAASANTKYHTFFNPVGSGKIAVIKRIGIYIDDDTNASYQAVSVRRISAASGGTAISVANVPKKNTGSDDSVMEFRYNNVTATLSGSGTDSRVTGLTAPGAVGQVIGQKEIVFGNRGNLILKPNEGIALYSEASGDVDQYVKFFVEWAEQVTEPILTNEYMTSVGQISGNASSNYVYAAFYNPPTSASTTLVKRLALRIDSAAAATTVPFSLMRISSSTGGTLITSSDIPKKNSSTTNSNMEIRRTGVTVTYSGNTERIAAVGAPSGVASAVAPALTGYLERVYSYDASSTQESFVLKPGEGFALRQEGAGFTGHRIFLDIEWEEVDNSNAPDAVNEFVYASPRMNATTTSGYIYGSLYNPADSEKDFILQRMEARSFATTSAVYIPASFRRISTSTAGVLISGTDIAKKNTSTPDSTAQVRNTGPSVSLSGTVESRLWTVITAGAVNQSNGISESVISSDNELILKPGEGVAFYQEAAGDTDQFYFFELQWKEIDSSNSISFSGTIYAADETTLLNSQPAIVLAVDGTTSGTTTAASNGTFTISHMTAPSSGAIITIWLNTNGGDYATLVFDYGSSCNGSCSGLKLYKNNLIIDSKNSSELTNSSLAACDNDSGSVCSDSDIGFTSNSGDLTLTWSSNTLRLPKTTSKFVPGGTITAQNFNQSNGTFDGGSSDLTFDGDFILAGGVATSTSGLLTVKGNWANSATFKHNNGTVEIDPLLFNGMSTISGMTATGTRSFYNFQSLKPGSIILFTPGEAVYIENTFRVEGSPGDPSTVRSEMPGIQWFLYVGNGIQAHFVRIADSGCVSGTQEISAPNGVLNTGNNGSCWKFIILGGGNPGGGQLAPPDDPYAVSGGGTLQNGSGQVVYDNQASAMCTSDGQADGACTTGNTKLTYSLTVGSGTNRALAVFVSVAGNSGDVQPSISTVTYAGASLTQKVHIAGNYYTDLWTLPDGVQPATGANNIVITLSSALITAAGTSGISSGAISASGVNQGATWTTTTSNSFTGNGTAVTATLGASGSGDLVVIGVCSGTSVNSTPHTSRYTSTTWFGSACGTAGGATDIGGTTSLSYTVGNDHWQIIGAAFQANESGGQGGGGQTGGNNGIDGGGGGGSQQGGGSSGGGGGGAAP